MVVLVSNGFRDRGRSVQRLARAGSAAFLWPSCPLAAKQKDGHHRPEGGVSVSMVNTFAVRQIGVGVGGQGNQGLQVVADDFGGDIMTLIKAVYFVDVNGLSNA